MRSRVAFKILLHDRATTAGSLIGVIAIVFLVGQQLSVLFGLFTYMSVLVDHSGADIWVCTKNTDNINATGTLPTRYTERILGLPGVAWAEPLLFGSGTFVTRDGRNEAVQVVGVRPARGALWPWRFQTGSAADLLQPDGVTLEAQDLRMYGNPRVGEVFEINGTRVVVAAITKGHKGFSGRLVFSTFTRAAQILQATPGRCKTIAVKVSPGIDARAVRARIRQILPETEVLSSAQLSGATRAYYVKNTGMGGSFGFSTLVGALVGIIIITLTMYTGVLQRQKDFAVLRALGARRVDIFVIVLCQSLMIGAAGIFIGFVLLSAFLQGTLDSPLPSYMPRWVSPLLAGGTLVLCMGGSLLAMRKAIRVEPASVFR